MDPNTQTPPTPSTAPQPDIAQPAAAPVPESLAPIIDTSSPVVEPAAELTPPPMPMTEVTPGQATPAVEAQPVTSEAPVGAVQTSKDPGHTLGVVSLIWSLLGGGIVSLIIGIIGLHKSHKVGKSNGLAVGGIVVSSVGIVVGTIFLLMITPIVMSGIQQCQELGAGTHRLDDGSTLTCNQQ